MTNFVPCRETIVRWSRFWPAALFAGSQTRAIIIAFWPFKGEEMKTYVAVTVLAGFLASMPVRAENPYPTSLGGPGTTFGMASEFNQLFAILSDEALRDIMCRLSGARFTPGRLSAALGMPEGQVLRRINTLRGWGLVRMVRHDSATTIVEPIPGERSQTLRRWANRYCSDGDSCGRPTANADSHRSDSGTSNNQGNVRDETNVNRGAGLGGTESALSGADSGTKTPGGTGMEKATFGAGCFWNVEEAFRQVDGVADATVGYAGGHFENPSYEVVCSGSTGHAEVVQVTFDPRKVSYERLLEVFWSIHDPTTLNRQGPDIGEQYRSVIFFHGPAQEAAARVARDKLASSGRYANPIVTDIRSAPPFFRAEDYHQRYLEKRRQMGFW